ncbi:MAG TPA: hypothetical protein VKT49_07695 [Bryobacteraceae bacterium]|nr:hypothetical protein [Bryobacteraceae bacterium]
MSPRSFLTMGGAASLLWTAGVLAQAPPSPAPKSHATAQVLPRTPDGHPDFQGVWTNATITPFERPAALSGKAILSESEAAALEEQAADARVDRPPAAGDPGAYNQLWFDRGTKVVGTRRSSLVIDPPDGRVPPLTPAAQKRRDEAAAYARQHPADGPESRSLAERCILWGTAGPPMVPGPYNNNYQIVQGPGYVMILVEMIHDVRFIPTDGRPHLPANIRQWMGDPRGHWEGDTLVVETTNFTGKTRFRGSDENLRVVEKFRRVDAHTLDYQFTIDDPTAFTKPWTADIPMTRGDGALYEYACHEGNYAMTDILSGARAQEKRGQ